MNKSILLKKQDGIATLLRPRFSAGLLLEDEDLTAAVDYTRNMMRLMLRSLFGCGVVCGLDVSAELACQGRKVSVTVKRGVAIDCLGNPIEVPKPTTFELDMDCKPLPPKIWVTVCYAEKCCRPRDISCSSEDEGQIVRTRSQEGYEIKVYSERPRCVCSCELGSPVDEVDDDDDCCGGSAIKKEDASTPANELKAKCDCYTDHYNGKCECDCGCSCVLIATVDTTKLPGDNGECIERTVDTDGQLLCVDATVRRRIRPLLTGFFDECVRPRLDQVQTYIADVRPTGAKQSAQRTGP